MNIHNSAVVQQPDMLESVDAYEHSELVARLQKKLGLSLEDAQQLFADMKHYLYLCAMSGEKLAPSPQIDAAWHEFLMYTRDYQDFCSQILGVFVHHNPNPVLTPHEVIAPKRTNEFAQQTFGTLSMNWSTPGYAECAPDSDCHNDGSCGGDV